MAHPTGHWHGSDGEGGPSAESGIEAALVRPIEQAGFLVTAGGGAFSWRPVILAKLEQRGLHAAGLAGGFELLPARLTKGPPAVSAAIQHEYVPIHAAASTAIRDGLVDVASHRRHPLIAGASGATGSQD